MKRFNKGFIRFFGSLGIVFWLQSSFDLDGLLNIFLNNAKPIIGNFLTGLITLVALSTLLYFLARCFFSGAYFMIASEPLSMYESNSSGKELLIYNSPAYPNITRILQYRNSKMKSMNNEQASELFIQTSKMDNLYKIQSGSRTAEVINFLEGKLGSMDNEKGLDFLRGKDF